MICLNMTPRAARLCVRPWRAVAGGAVEGRAAAAAAVEAVEGVAAGETPGRILIQCI